jgi:quercetin dioxygenase-like cupin family protein
VPSFAAPEYLLRVVQSGGPPGARTPVHTHPGSETFYVMSGELSQKTPEGVSRISAGQSMPGHPPNTPMQVSSSGTSDLSALVMFVKDATKPFSSPAYFGHLVTAGRRPAGRPEREEPRSARDFSG